MRVVIMSDSASELARVYPNDVRLAIAEDYGNVDIVCKRDITTGAYRDVSMIFSTWGMPTFTAQEIATYLPQLKHIYYAAGSVQAFAAPFLERGVKIYSSWKANAVPVAEFTVAQIFLASKGYYRAMRKELLYWTKIKHNRMSRGNYGLKVGLLGVGGVGSLVAEMLQRYDMELYCYDPYLSDESAAKLNIAKRDIDWIFSNCDVVSNHLADKPQLNKLIDYCKLNSMPHYSTFINTGRGAQVDERGLSRAMARDKTKTALLDVTCREPLGIMSPLRRRRNVIVTPHIAGSSGAEVVRMSRLMIDVARRVGNGEAVDCEVTNAMLEAMA